MSLSLSLACQYLMMPLWSPEMSVFPEWLHAIDRTALVCAFSHHDVVTTMNEIITMEPAAPKNHRAGKKKKKILHINNQTANK